VGVTTGRYRLQSSQDVRRYRLHQGMRKGGRTYRSRHYWSFNRKAVREKKAEMKTCLMVDDSSVIRKIARNVLEEMNFRIVEAEDGEQALQVCKCELPDAVLLDWNMPVMDGYEFLSHLRRLPGGDRPKVVFCTTENNLDHISRALRGGANEYIMKPFNKDIIAAKFQEVGLLPPTPLAA
jgi:two-component system chemotaxis response regulator CheY